MVTWVWLKIPMETRVNTCKSQSPKITVIRIKIKFIEHRIYIINFKKYLEDIICLNLEL